MTINCGKAWEEKQRKLREKYKNEGYSKFLEKEKQEEIEYQELKESMMKDYDSSNSLFSEENLNKPLIPKSWKIGICTALIAGTIGFFGGGIYVKNMYENSNKKIQIYYQQEKAKLDSIYQAKQDSLKRVYENKLEKGVK